MELQAIHLWLRHENLQRWFCWKGINTVKKKHLREMKEFIQRTSPASKVLLWVLEKSLWEPIEVAPLHLDLGLVNSNLVLLH